MAKTFTKLNSMNKQAYWHNIMDTYIIVVDTEKFKLIPKFGRIESSVIGCPHLPQAFCAHGIETILYHFHQALEISQNHYNKQWVIRVCSFQGYSVMFVLAHGRLHDLLCTISTDE